MCLCRDLGTGPSQEAPVGMKLVLERTELDLLSSRLRGESGTFGMMAGPASPAPECRVARPASGDEVAVPQQQR